MVEFLEGGGKSFMKKLAIVALAAALCIFTFSSYASADNFTADEVKTVEVSKTELVEPQWRAIANGLTYWGKQAVNTFFSNGGGFSVSNEDLVSNSELETAFDR